MPVNNNTKTFPFTEDHLNKLREELDDAGSYFNLMLRKKAISRKLGMKHITLYNDIEKYKRKYLTGVYESLHPYYETEMPYIFWSAMYEMLLKTEQENV